MEGWLFVYPKERKYTRWKGLSLLVNRPILKKEKENIKR
jgi:hypothetical protein